MSTSIAGTMKHAIAHPIDREPVTKADELIESAYATRAKLVMQTPSKNKAWIAVNERVRAFPTREYLLVSNSGPDGDGYHYCTGCGRIESAKDPETNLFQQHSRPFLSDESEACPGTFTASKNRVRRDLGGVPSSADGTRSLRDRGGD